MPNEPQTYVAVIDNGLRAGHSIDQIRATVARVWPDVTATEVERAARMLRECRPTDPDPLTDSEIQAITDEIGALPDPRDGWPRVGTSDTIDRAAALQQVAAAAVVARHSTTGTDLDDLLGALGLGHAHEVAVRAEQPDLEVVDLEVAHVHDPGPAWNERGVSYAWCECGAEWWRGPCPTCGQVVAGLDIARGHCPARSAQ